MSLAHSQYLALSHHNALLSLITHATLLFYGPRFLFIIKRKLFTKRVYFNCNVKILEKVFFSKNRFFAIIAEKPILDQITIL